MVADGYKQTEYGLIPNDWIDTEFQNALDGFSSGMTPYRGNPEYYKGSIKWITSGELNYNIIYDTIEHITLDAVKKTNLRILPKGTFLMAITGLEAAGTRGSCAIVGAEATTNQSCMAIFSTRKLSVKYFYHFYVKYGNLLAFKYCQGTKQQSYTAKIAKVLPIIYPSDRKEQQAIATALSDTDELINSLEKLISKKEAIKTGTMQELLTGKKRLDGFSGEWEEKTLGNIGTFSKGSGVKKDEANSGDIACIRYGEIYTLHHEYIKRFASYISRDVMLTAKKLKQGDLLFAGSGETKEDIGKCVAYLNDFIAYGGGDIVILSPRNVDSLFMGFLLNIPTIAIQKASKGQGDAVVHISASSLAEIEVKIPKEIKEQQAISTILSDMDSDIDALKTKLSKVKAIKEGMMQELLTGKTRLLRGATDEHP